MKSVSMQQCISRFVSVLVACALTCWFVPAQPLAFADEGAQGHSLLLSGEGYVPGEVIVVYESGYEPESQDPQAVPRVLSEPSDAADEFGDEGQDANDANDDADALGADTAASFEELGIEVVEELAGEGSGAGAVVLADLAGYDGSVEDAVEALSQLDGVAYVQPNYLYTLIDDDDADDSDDLIATLEEAASDAVRAVSVNDPRAVNATGRNGQYYLYGESFPEAWSLAQVEGAVTVAVFDTGCRYTHEDLAGVVDTEHAYDAYYGEHLERFASSNYDDSDSHGTYVCGIIAAQANNGLGIAGCSYNASILPVKVFSDREPGDTDGSTLSSSTAVLVSAYAYIEGLVDAGEVQNLRVVNMSLGGYNLGDDTALEQAIETARQDYGVLTVCAGGNGSSDGPNTAFLYPADYDACMAVTALNADGTNRYKSDYNEYKDISAYGDYVLSTIGGGSSGKATSYSTKSGTSTAAPQVSAAAALLWAKDSSLSVDQVVAALETTADAIEDEVNDRSQVSGSHGKLNAYAALASIAGTDDDGGDTNGGEGGGEGGGGGGNDDEPVPTLSYTTHVQRQGWQDSVGAGEVSGTTGSSLRLEAITISLGNMPCEGSIQYMTHVQTYGWESEWAADGAISGTSGESKRLEAIKIQLTGEIAEKYDVYYRVHAQYFGWMGWAKNGEAAGTAGYSYRLEAIQIVLAKKAADGTSQAPDTSDCTTAEAYKASRVTYRTHVQSDGWQSWKAEGVAAGTVGRSLRLEGITIKLTNNAPYEGGIEYRTHVQTYGWESSWAADGAMSGTSGESKRLEAIQIRLTGEMAQRYDVYYRVHAQTYGWLGWAKNGEEAGTAGLSRRLEGIEIVLVEKGGEAPGSTANAFVQG